jgi:hypothetical protein
MANDKHYKPRKHINCVNLLAELKELSLSRRRSFRSISLGDYSTADQGNHNTYFRCLAAFLIDWEEIEELTIEMPNDLNASENCDTDDYTWWGRLLPQLLLGAFARGRWREVRLAHPRMYSGFSSPYLFHNVERYVEEWILPKQARLQCEESRYLLLDYVVHIYDSRPQLPKPTKAEVNERCEREWGRRGIDCRLEDPRPGERGTVIAIRWIEGGMQEKRRQMVLEGTKREASNNETMDGDRFPWQVQGIFPAFLQSLLEWQVVLCTAHRSCFSIDTLQHHLIHFRYRNGCLHGPILTTSGN